MLQTTQEVPMARPSWDEYFMSFAYVASTRSACLRRTIGAVLMRDRMIVSTGYNGPPRGIVHCDRKGCIRERLEIESGTQLDICAAVHAEINAINHAAYHGMKTKGSTLYTTHYPCGGCARSIVNAGIVRIVYCEAYPGDAAAAVLTEAGISTERIGKPVIVINAESR